MPALEKPDSPLTTNVKWRFPSVHPEGRKVLVIAGNQGAGISVSGEAVNGVNITIWTPYSHAGGIVRGIALGIPATGGVERRRPFVLPGCVDRRVAP